VKYDAVGQALARLLTANAREHDEAAARLDLSGRDLTALAYVARVGETSPQRLADALVLSSSGASALTQRLTNAGLLQRSTVSGRHVRAALTLTPEGHAVLRSVRAWLDRAVGAAVEDLDQRELAIVERFVVRLADSAERHADEMVRHAIRRTELATSVPQPPSWG
jgi:DNA-binding MarR family transcriptional regulator